MHAQVDYNALRFWLSTLQLAGIVVIGVYSWWTNRNRVTRTKFNQLDVQLQDVQQGLTDMKSTLSKKVEKGTFQKDIDRMLARIKIPCQKHHDRTSALEDRSSRIEVEVAHLPSQKDINNIHSLIGEVKGDVKGIAEGMTGLRHAVDIMNRHLMGEDKG